MGSRRIRSDVSHPPMRGGGGARRGRVVDAESVALTESTLSRRPRRLVRCRCSPALDRKATFAPRIRPRSARERTHQGTQEMVLRSAAAAYAARREGVA